MDTPIKTGWSMPSFSKLAANASSLVRGAGKATVSLLAPSTGPVAEATEKAVAAGGEGLKAVGESVGGAIDSAGEGIKTGFGWGMFVVVLLLGLYVMGLFRNATGGSHA